MKHLLLAAGLLSTLASCKSGGLSTEYKRAAASAARQVPYTKREIGPNLLFRFGMNPMQVRQRVDSLRKTGPLGLYAHQLIGNLQCYYLENKTVRFKMRLAGTGAVDTADAALFHRQMVVSYGPAFPNFDGVEYPCSWFVNALEIKLALLPKGDYQITQVDLSKVKSSE